MKHQVFQHRSGESHRMICRAVSLSYAFDDRAHLIKLLAKSTIAKYRRMVIEPLTKSERDARGTVRA